MTIKTRYNIEFMNPEFDKTYSQSSNGFKDKEIAVGIADSSCNALTNMKCRVVEVTTKVVHVSGRTESTQQKDNHEISKL